jgi:hypothetical protein
MGVRQTIAVVVRDIGVRFIGDHLPAQTVGISRLSARSRTSLASGQDSG